MFSFVHIAESLSPLNRLPWSPSHNSLSSEGRLLRLAARAIFVIGGKTPKGKSANGKGKISKSYVEVQKENNQTTKFASFVWEIIESFCHFTLSIP